MSLPSAPEPAGASSPEASDEVLRSNLGAPRLGLLRSFLLWAAGLSPVVLILFTNPLNRVYSHHGYIHASIIYRIVHTGVPPTHPFLADQPLPYYWGYHLLAAGFVKLGMTPGWAGALINLLTLFASMGVAWWIACQLVSSPARPGGGSQISGRRIALAAAFAALFAPSYLPPNIFATQVAAPLGLAFADPRALPIAIKFVNQSGMTLGVLFSLTWMASLIGLYQGRRAAVCAVGIAISLLCCAFFYPPMLPSLVLGTPAVALLFLWKSSAEVRRLQWRRAVLACFSGAAGVLLLMPYLLQVAESLRGNTQLMDLRSLGRGLLWTALLFLPTLAYLRSQRHHICGRMSSTPIMVLVAVVGSSLLLYLCVNQPLRTEYKYLSVAMIASGFVAGAVFAAAWKRTSWISWCIALIFVATPSYAFYQKLEYHTEYPTEFIESGSDLLFTGEVERESLYAWIREESPKDALFLDPLGFVPIYGQRGALMAPVKRGQVGFGGGVYEFLAVHDTELLERRAQVLSGRASEEVTRQVIPSDVPVFRIVYRKESWGIEFDPKLWRQVFRTPHKHFRILAWIGDDPK